MNAWVVGDVDPVTDQGGVCLLDQFTFEEIGCVLQTNPTARKDLPLVTQDPEILALLDKYPLLSSEDTSVPLEMRVLGAPPSPFYTLMKGRLSDFL